MICFDKGNTLWAAMPQPMSSRQCLARTLAVLAISLWGYSAVSAAEPNYQPWNGSVQKADTSSLQELIDELRTLIDAGDRSRAADPRFIADLRAALRRHDYPWRRTLVLDDFRDGNHTVDPVWTVANGDFTVAWGGGLASAVQDTIAAPAPASNQQGERKVRAEDMAVALLGQLLTSKNRQQTQTAPSQPQRQNIAAQPAEIFLSAPITNAFALTATISSRPMDQSGGLDLGVYQDTARQIGYRLSYTPGSGMTLYRQSSRGASIIDGGGTAINLADGSDHVVEWFRAPDGTMTARLDGELLFTTVDRSFRDSFAGFTLINRGGDYMLRAIKIDGTI